MPAVINSAPDCVTSVDGAMPADDSADFVLQAAYETCAGFMTFGPGSTYGEEGEAAATLYYLVTWLAIAVTVVAFVAWFVAEQRRFATLGQRIGLRGRGPGEGTGPTTTTRP